MSFSLAIFSADSPMVWPVVYSAIAGATGARSAGRSLPKAPIFCGSVLARLAAMKVCAALRENWMGTLDSDSAPPASTTSASPERIAPAAKVIARVEEAQARFTVTPGMRNGSEVRKTTSRPRFGASSAGTTTPKTERSISSGSIAVRATSSDGGDAGEVDHVHVGEVGARLDERRPAAVDDRHPAVDALERAAARRPGP